MKKGIFLLVLICGGAGILQAATAFNEDSLKRVLRNTKQDTSRIKLYLEWDAQIYYQNPRLDIDLNQRVVEICDRNLKKNELSKKEKKFYIQFKAVALNNLGLAFSNQGIYAEALSSFQLSIKLANSLNDTITLANAMNNVGVVYWNKKEFVKAEKYFKQCITIAEQRNDVVGKAEILNNLGLVYKDQKNFNMARASYVESLELIKYDSSLLVMANILTNIGLLYAEENKHEIALNYYERASRIFEKLNYLDGTGDVHVETGKSLRFMGKPKQACEHCLQAYKIGEENGLVMLQRDASLCLYRSYQSAGDLQKALFYCILYANIQDSLNSRSNATELERIELKYEFENKAKEQRLKLAGERKAAAERLKHEKTQRYFLYSGLVLVLAFAGFMFNRFKVTQRQKKIIEIQQKETRRAKEQVEEKNREVLDSINYAKRLQEAILPAEAVLKKHFPEHYILYLPKDIVAGDFYWLETRGATQFFAVADCTGHGVPGAMVSVVCHNALNRAVLEFGLTKPGEILDKVRGLVLETFESKGSEVKDGMDITLVCLDKKSENAWNVQFAGANNPLLILRKDGTDLEEIKADKQPVGRFAVEKPFTTHSLEVNKGDTLYFYTDGFPDQFGGETGKKLKAVYMKKLILSIKHKDLQEQGNYMRYAFEKWKGSLEQIDDVCMAGIKF